MIVDTVEPYYFLLMNLKRIFGAILTILGIVGLIYAAVTFANESADTKEMIVFGSLGLLFFIAGIGLVKTTKDEGWKVIVGKTKISWFLGGLKFNGMLGAVDTV